MYCATCFADSSTFEEKCWAPSCTYLVGFYGCFKVKRWRAWRKLPWYVRVFKYRTYKKFSTEWSNGMTPDSDSGDSRFES